MGARLRDLSPLPPLPPGDYSKHTRERLFDQNTVNQSTAEGSPYRPPREGWDRWLAKREAARRRTADIPFERAPRGYCRWCGQDLGALRKDPRRRWHADCAAAYRAVMSQGAIRAQVWDRDHGWCVDCPPETPPWPLHTEHLFPCGSRANSYECPRSWRADLDIRAAHYRGRVCLAKPHQCGKPVRTGWEADHVIEVVDGGNHDLGNLVTRCIAHHQQKTNASRRARKTDASQTVLEEKSA